MGMSASQARLLSLTARQSNLEFEGQQINQQRTNLSNQSANYYNSLLTMTVPTPPSTDDYTTVKYSFVIGGNDATIAQVLPQDKLGNYLVEYTTNLATIGVQENKAYKITAAANENQQKTGTIDKVSDQTIYDDEKEYYVQIFREDDKHGEFTAINNQSENYSADRLNDAQATFYDKYGNQVEKDKAVENGELKNDYTALVNKQAEEVGYSTAYVKLADKSAFETARNKGEIVIGFTENTIDTPDDQKGSDKIQTLVASNSANFCTVAAEYSEAFLNAGLDINEYYQYQASTGIRFAKKEDIEKSANNSTLAITTFAVASMNSKQTTSLSHVQIEFDTTGRISSMTDAEGNTYVMTASTETDDAAYEDAYNQYTYDQYLYDQKQNEINAHIEILQAQDKNLELRLSQLNTEHNAIQTEMEAVNKVLNKNIETSFKTFNA